MQRAKAVLGLAVVGLVGVELVQVTYFAEHAPHVFDDLHVIKRCFQRCCAGLHGFHRQVPGMVGRDSHFLTSDPRCFPGFPLALPVLADVFERFPMLVANFTRFFCRSSGVFRLVQGSLRRSPVVNSRAPSSSA
jgi:hypothetical protein